MVEPSHGENNYRFTPDSLLLLANDVQLAVLESSYRISGTRELLTAIVPVVDLLMTMNGAAMIHAACFDVRGVGVAMPAWGGVGKTSTIAKLASMDGVGFMGDDWAFLSGSGNLLGYAKPMYIKPHHREIYPHIFESHKKPLIPKSMSSSISKMTTVVHPAITKYPQLASVIRRWSPEYITVRPDEALPTMQIVQRSPLGASVFVERSDNTHAVLTPQDASWMADRMIGNFHSELSGPSRELLVGASAVGLIPLDRLLSEKRQVLEQALREVPNGLLRVPAQWSADEASDAIVEHLFRFMAQAGLAV
jgi:hypothetical protein